ncbi:MAG TPA: hypothetical protein DFR83_20495, partial [Deltaproteobacteria bacterium]|nr:hypothetical protein [Deltaproteobacteria bacterium]
DADADADADIPATTAVMATVSEDYAVGVLATASLDSWSVTDEIVDISSDPVVVSSGGFLFQINRLSYDTIRVYTPGDWSAPLTEFALADLANPHDVEVCNDKAFITQYGRNDIAIYDHTTGILAGVVDLSAYDDGDGTPEASHMVQAANGKLYVAYQNLDRNDGWASVGGGVVEIDCNSQAISNQWDFANPAVFDHAPDTSKVVVYESGVGLHVLDTEAGTASLVLDEASVGAGIIGYTAHETGAVVGISDSSYNYGIGCIDLSDWSYSLAEMVNNYVPSVDGNNRGEAWISARSHWSNPAAENGVIVYDVDSCSALTTEGPVSTVLAPSSIAFY